MKNKLKGDKRLRSSLQQLEQKYYVFKVLCFNTVLDLASRTDLLLRLRGRLRWALSTKFKNRCALSGRGRSVFSRYRLSRLSLKECVKLRKLVGCVFLVW